MFNPFRAVYHHDAYGNQSQSKDALNGGNLLAFFQKQGRENDTGNGVDEAEGRKE